MARLASPIKLACLMLTITQLLCDTNSQNKRSLVGLVRANEQEVNSDLDADNSADMQSAKSFQMNDRDNKQQFLEEPQDVYAVVGQPEVAFSCVVLGKRGLMAWRYSKPSLLATDLLVIDTFRENPIYVTLDRFSVSQPNQSLGHHQSGQQPPQRDTPLKNTLDQSISNKDQQQQQQLDDDLIASNYTLHLTNVTLENDDYYQCSVQAVDKAHRFIESRRARLSVLQPPTRLDLTVVRVSPDNREEFHESGPDPQDTPSTFNDPSPSASSNSAALDRPQPVRVLEVEENDIVRLECATNQAKPEAEIVWFDSDTGRPIEAGAPQKPPVGVVVGVDQLDNSDNSPTPPDSDSITIETRTQPVAGSFPLARTISVLSIRADRKLHHNKVFTCQTKHKAYELDGPAIGAGSSPSTSLPSSAPARLRPLRQSARVSVLYRPQVRLSKDDLQPTELAPISFKCEVDARPAVQNYSWFVDDQLIEGARESELRIDQLTRQLHLREIKCEARNLVGVGSALIRLAVKYSPAYVTHLLPASLQPDHNQHEQHHHSAPDKGGASGSGRLKQLQPGRSLFSKSNRPVGRELALSRLDHENITLRCDFDSNPGPVQIQWFKISTDYSTMKDISPRDADELIEIGATHAQFLNFKREQQHQTQSPTAPEYIMRQSWRDHEKRHINQASGLKQQQPPPPAESVDEPQTGSQPLDLAEASHQERIELDFEHMSRDLLIEMNVLEAKQQHQNQQMEALRAQNVTADGQEARVVLIEPVDSEPISQSNTHKIREPVAFVVRRQVDLADSTIVVARQKGRLPAATRLGGSTGETQPNRQTQSSNKHQQQHQSTMRVNELVLLSGQQELDVLIGKQRERNSSHTTRHHQRASANWFATERVLSDRQAQLTSSSLVLKNVNHESIGKYVCLAKAHDGFETVAKAVYFVLKQPPRIISQNKQTAPLGAHELQVECLAQINTVLDNQTRIQWFKEGKLIDGAHKVVAGRPDKTFTISEQLSPDALFMRSTLLIGGAEYSDFGLYNCTITNTLGTDSMPIFLQPTASTGFAFTVMAQLVMASLVLFVMIVCVLFALTPCKHFDSFAGRKSIAALKAKNMVVMADGKAHLADVEPSVRSANERSSNSPSSQSNQSATKRSINSSQASTVTHQDELDQAPTSCAMTTEQQLQQPPPLPPAPLLAQQHASIMMMQNGFQNGTSARLSIRPGSAMGTSSTFGTACQELGGSMSRDRLTRASLRSECNYQTPARNGRSSTALQQQPQQQHTTLGPSRFAAIHETLEHKLNFGTNGADGGFVTSNSMPANRLDDQSDNSQQQGAAATNQLDSTVKLGFSSNHVELTSKDSLSNVTKQTSTSLVDKIRNRFKSAGAQDGTSLKNKHVHSSGSSSTLGKSRPTISMPIGGMIRRSSLSNSLTLVGNGQDLAKSSQPNGAQLKHAMMINLNHISGGTESNLISSSANLIQNSGTTSDNTTSSGRSSSASNNPNGHPQQFHLQQQQQQQQPAFVVPHLNLAYQHQQPPQPPQQWTHHQVQLTPSNCDNNMLYANSANLYDLANDQQQLYANSYQQAIDPNSLVSPYGQYQPQQQILVSQQQQQPQIMTSDGGDAYFESNYGTLLSRSSAYKTLGYDISNFIS